MASLFQVKYNAACLEREDIRERNSKMQTEICNLKETSDRHAASSQIEVSLIMLNTFCSYIFVRVSVDLLQVINVLK